MSPYFEYKKILLLKQIIIFLRKLAGKRNIHISRKGYRHNSRMKKFNQKVKYGLKAEEEKEISGGIFEYFIGLPLNLLQ